MAKKTRCLAMTLLTGVLALSLVRLAVLAAELLPREGVLAGGEDQLLGWCAAAAILVVGGGALAALSREKSDSAEEEA